MDKLLLALAPTIAGSLLTFLIVEGGLTRTNRRAIREEHELLTATTPGSWLHSEISRRIELRLRRYTHTLPTDTGLMWRIAVGVTLVAIVAGLIFGTWAADHLSGKQLVFAFPLFVMALIGFSQIVHDQLQFRWQLRKDPAEREQRRKAREIPITGTSRNDPPDW